MGAASHAKRLSAGHDSDSFASESDDDYNLSKCGSGSGSGSGGGSGGGGGASDNASIDKDIVVHAMALRGKLAESVSRLQSASSDGDVAMDTSR